MRPKSPVTILRAKVRRGEPLTTDDRDQLRTYYSRYYRVKQGVHLKGDREERWRALAAARGIGLGPWMQEMVELALRGPGQREREMAEELQKLRDAYTWLQGSNAEVAAKNTRLEVRLAEMEATLMRAVAKGIALVEATA
ncbi:MAG: hypothetical protein V4510_05740 [bacterium]